MSTSQHPQTDGQTERTNRTLEQVLRHYVAYDQDDWDIHLSAVEFAYNNAVQSSTKETPFMLNYGHHPRSNIIVMGLMIRYQQLKTLHYRWQI